MRNENIIKRVSQELNIPIEIIILVYNKQWEFIKGKIEELPLMEDLNEDQFNKLRPNFNLPSFGKFYVTYQKFLNSKKRYKILMELKNKENE